MLGLGLRAPDPDAEVVEVSQRRFIVWDVLTNVAMAVVLGAIAWKAYGLIRPLIWDDSIPLPVTFTETPTVEDHLPDGFISPDGFDLAQSRFAGQTQSGVQFWLLASSEETGELCLYARLRDESGALSCATLEHFAALGVTVGYEEAGGTSDGILYAGVGRYLAAEMEADGEPTETRHEELFSFLEVALPDSDGLITAFLDAEISGGRALDLEADPEE